MDMCTRRPDLEHTLHTSGIGPIRRTLSDNYKVFVASEKDAPEGFERYGGANT